MTKALILSKEENLRAIAEAFMLEQPEEYEGESFEEVVEQLKNSVSDAFIEFTYDTYYPPRVH